MRLLLLLLSCICLVSAQAGVPGTTGTISGYDTELGTDPICWTGSSTATSVADASNVSETTVVTPFPNPVVKDFDLLGETKLLLECPAGVRLEAFAPKEFGTPPDYNDGIRPRAGQWYNFSVQFTIDQLGLRGNRLVSDENSTVVAVQIVVCELGKVGFCSPFIHEEANARLEAQGIRTPPARGDRHGGTHVHSPYVMVPVDATTLSQSFNVSIPLIINDPGSFYAIGALQFYTSSQQQVAEYRYDIAAALDETLLTYQEEPDVLTLTNAVKIITYVLIGIACAAILFLLYHTIKHRSNNIIRVSQGNFLIVFLVAALWASVSTILLEPKNDVFCNLFSPMILIPLQLMFAITIGRLWRIQAVVSPLLARKLQSGRSFPNFFSNTMSQVTSCTCLFPKKNSLRRSITCRQLAGVVAFFTLPQIIFQVVGYVLDPNEATIEFNDDESTGRMICSSMIEPWTSFRLYALILLFLLFVILLVLSYACRNLPSLLGETSSICTTTIENLVVVVVAFAILLITDSPTCPPDVPYLVMCIAVLTLTLNSTWRTMLPKLRMVWRGENLVISKLVTDHRLKYMQSQSSVLDNVTGFTPGQYGGARPSSVNSTGHSASYVRASTSHMESETSLDVASLANKDEKHSPCTEVTELESHRGFSFSEGTRGGEGTTDEDIHLTAARKQDERNVNETTEAGPANLDERRAAFHASLSLSERETFQQVGESSELPLERRNSTRHLHHPILISDDETPTRRLVLRLVDLQFVLNRVNQRILSGLVVSHQDWKTLQEFSVELGTVFRDEVKFKWEDDSMI